MAEIITGDTTKGIKGVGELALRISRFDSYRLFTLYENIRDRKVMNISGDQKYYLVFRSPKKEIRIPEYEPNGLFEVDKVNGCILFKITKKNAEDILSMKTAGERIFHIVRTFENVDEYGKVLSVTDEVEVYNGKWGDDATFSAYSTENKVDLLSKALAAQVDKNANMLTEYNDLQEKYNEEMSKSTDLEKEVESLRAERDSLQTQLNEYLGDTYDGTVLSSNTKYIAFEDTLNNVSFTEEQLADAMAAAIGKEGISVSDDIGDPSIRVIVPISEAEDLRNSKITVYKNDICIGISTHDASLNMLVYINNGDVFRFECTGATTSDYGSYSRVLVLKYEPLSASTTKYVDVTKPSSPVSERIDKSIVSGKINFNQGDGGSAVKPDGSIGTLRAFVE